MSAILTVLTKTVVAQFYRQNAGLLAIVFLIAGSFLRAIEHITLAQVAVHTHFLLAIYAGIWAVYSFHTTRFTVQIINNQPILYHLRILPATLRYTAWVIIQLQLLFPVIVYAGFVAIISIREQAFVSSWAILLIVTILTLWPLIWYTYILRNPSPDRLSSRFNNWLGKHFTTPYELFFLRLLVSQKPVLLFLTKAGALLVLIGVCLLYPTDDYDIRLLALGCLLAALTHIAVMYQLYQFEHERLALYRNMPASTANRLRIITLIVFFLFLPEGILLVRYSPNDLSLMSIASILAFGHSLLVLQYCLLLAQHRSLDKTLTVLFWLLIGSFFAIMYQLPLWGLALLNWCSAAWLFARYYWQSAWKVD